MRYYHYIALAPAALLVALGATFSGSWESILLYLLGMGIAAWVGNVLRRERNRTKPDVWREENRSVWKGESIPWRRQATFLGIVVVALLAVVVVATVSNHSSHSGPQTYKDEVYNFSFTYPGSWQMGKNSTSTTADVGLRVAIVDPHGTKTNDGYLDSATVTVYRLAPDAESTPTDAIVNQVMADLTAQFPDARLTEPLHKTVIGGKSGWGWTSTFTRESLPMKMSVYWLISAGTVYEVGFRASQANWAADAPVFDSILANFQAP
jgi:hypothetical protein